DDSPRDGEDGDRTKRKRRRRRGRKSSQDERGAPVAERDGGGAGGNQRSQRKERPERQRVTPSREASSSNGGGGSESGPRPTHAEGMFLLDKGDVSVLRTLDNQWLSSKSDVYVPKKLVDKYKLHDGMMLKGPLGRGYKHKFQLENVDEIDGQPPAFWKHKPLFKSLTSIDPDFHYSVGDVTDDVSMRMVDLLSPIGRGQRGLLVAPPRSGKTTLMRQFAAGIEKGYPDVKLMVLLIDERPEEATEWKRSVTTGQVFASTADETAKHHIQLAEVVWKRAMRLVEMGEDVVILLDSITRLARAYNNQSGGSGRTMSGGLDSRAMERPRKIFGSARNTVEAGSLTIIGTTLIDTGSRMDQLVFEEFKGTGNMELVLNRKLADRRIFPAIDIERTGTRKEEKLVGMRRLKLIHVLRRVLARMHFTEAADLLITRLSDVSRTDEFLERFTVDPEA
ncbi:MAG: transcription termination factor Rho, partial [Paracoccaceae bacterium]